MGGRDPNGFQSVMLRPDLVRRVTPPMWTIPKTRDDVPRSHLPNGACGLRLDCERIGRPLEMDVIDDAADDGGVIFFDAILLLLLEADDCVIADCC